MSEIDKLKNNIACKENIINHLADNNIELQKQLKRKEQECERLKEQLDEIISQSALLPKFFGLTADEITNMLKQLDQLKAENEILEKVNKKNQEKIKKLNETLQEEFIAKQYGDEALFFTLMDIKEIAETAVKGGYATKSFDYTQGMETIGSYVLQKIKEVIKDEE